MPASWQDASHWRQSKAVNSRSKPENGGTDGVCDEKKRISNDRQLIQAIDIVPRRYATLVIGIDGCGGSGKSTLASALAAECPKVTIVHIGSTSVPGLKAKPIIDMMPVVKDIEKIDSYREKMEGLGYECMGEFGITGRRYVRKGGDNRTHQVHVFQADNKEDIQRHVAVRDYLRTHPEAVKQYGELKENLANQFPQEIEAYMDGKDAFVKELEKRALHW